MEETKIQEIKADAEFPELDGLRGCAALFIVFFHLPKWNNLIDINIINNAHLLVGLFFVLSGFVIHQRYSGGITNKRNLIKFQLLRLGRVYPVHILMLLIFFGFEVFKYVALSKYGIAPSNSIPFKQNSINALFQQLFLIHAIGPTGNGNTYNSPAWSISVEFYTYFIFGLIILYAKKIRTFIFVILFLGSYINLSLDYIHGYADLSNCMAGFFLGCMLGEIALKKKYIVSKYLSIFVLIALLSFIQFNEDKGNEKLFYLFSFALIASLIFQRNGLLSKFLKSKPIVWLGLISYSIYMSHAGIIWIANQVIRFGLKKDEVLINHILVPQLTNNETYFFLILILGSTIGFSIFLHKYIENPIRAKIRKYLSNHL